MMKLSAMQSLGGTTREDGSNPIAEQILEMWGYDSRSVREFRYSTNFVFRFRQDGIERFLRFSPAWERDVKDIQAETHLLSLLKARGFRIAEPLPSKSGHLVETVDTEGGVFHAVVFTALAGQQLEIEELGEAEYRQWGTALGTLHEFVKTELSEDLVRPSYEKHLTFMRELIASDVTALHMEYETIAEWMQSLNCSKTNFGLIHFDFELDNLYWDESGLQMLDFDDSAYYWYVADIAYALRDLFEGGVDLKNPSFQSFLAGYRSASTLDETALDSLPMFLRFRDLMGYADMKHALDLSLEETEEWLKPLHNKLTGRMQSYRASLHQQHAK